MVYRIQNPRVLHSQTKTTDEYFIQGWINGKSHVLMHVFFTQQGAERILNLIRANQCAINIDRWSAQ